MVAIANYFASVSVKPDERGLKAVDNYLKAIENKLRKGTNGNGTGKGLVLNVSINQRFLRKSIADTIEKGVFRAKITPVLNKGSLQAIKQQIQSLFTAPINVRVNATASGRTSSGSRSSPRTGAAYSWSPNPSGRGGATPHLAEWWAGRPGRSSLSAANRRYSDMIMNQGFFGPEGAPKTLRGFAGETLFGGIGRAGSSTMVGRGLSSFGSAIGGARGGALGLIGGAALSGITGATKGIWTGLAATVTAPFKLVGGAIDMVTSGFYRLALTVAPLIGGFMLLNRTVQQGSQRQIALNTVSKSLGSTGQQESAWLRNMASRDGMRYNTLIDPFTSFIASASPAMGLSGAKDVFESFTQFGLTRGANDISMGLAMKAVSQIAGKGRVQAEELNF